MRKFIITLIVTCFLIGSFTFAQQEAILAGQMKAIRTLAAKQGFTNETLDEYLAQKWGSPLAGLTRKDGAALIRLFQSADAPTPAEIRQPGPVKSELQLLVPELQKPIPKPKPKPKEPPKPKIAEVLEVGMSKRFHLIDGNIIRGEIVKIEGNVCHIETIDGLLYIPSGDILEETATVTKKDATRYIGPILRETTEEIVLRSKYGDVVISKRDVKQMDRFHGGKRVPWAEEKKTFFRGEVILTDIFMDPTAFPLEPHTLYVSGLSLGYGFTERFMVRTAFGSNLSGDLNVHPLLRFYHRQTGTNRRAAAIGAQLFNHHPMETVVAKYAKYVKNSAGTSLDKIAGASADSVLHADSEKQFYWEFYAVLSSRRALATHRGEVGWHVGFRTNSLLLQRPQLISGYEWDMKALVIPFRVWASFEYDLTKNLKLAGLIWADNSHKFRTFSESWEDYFEKTPFILDSKKGEYRMVDFDFGFLYSVTETFTVGIHFQEPFLVFYWEFFEL